MAIADVLAPLAGGRSIYILESNAIHNENGRRDQGRK